MIQNRRGRGRGVEPGRVERRIENVFEERHGARFLCITIRSLFHWIFFSLQAFLIGWGRGSLLLFHGENESVEEFSGGKLVH